MSSETIRTEAFVSEAIRTPIGNLGGGLSAVRPDDLAAHAIRKLLERCPGLDPSSIDDLVLGCANQAGEDNRNVARMALLLAGLPESVPGMTVNRLCASGLSAVAVAMSAIRAGDGELFVAGGVESMTRAPFALSKASSAFSRSQELFDTSLGWRFVNPSMRERFGVDSMGETAENVAERYKIEREAQDAFAAWSQSKAAAARERGRFEREIAPVEIPQPKGPATIFSQDEFIRPGTSAESLAKLKPVFRKDGSVTAGNASGLNDGAAALIVGSERALSGAKLAPKARLVSCAASGVEPRVMGIGPVKATRLALERAGLELGDMDVIELNEAFAAQVLACTRELGLADRDERVNPNGGAIALGHPLGMSGARLVQTACHELSERKGRYALCAMCVGVGQGMALILERV